MTGDINQFSNLEKKIGGNVTFGDNGKGNIIGKGTVGNSSFPSLIEDMLLVENLNYNLLSVSQLCDKGFKVVFETSKCSIIDCFSGKTIFNGNHFENIFTIDVSLAENVDKCFVSISKESWLWQCSFLEMSHSWRNCKEYDGRTKRKVPPRNFSIEDILSQLEAISQSIPWKAITTLK